MIKNTQGHSLALSRKMPEQKILLSNEEYIIFWTPHAQERIKERMKEDFLIYYVFLEKCLEDIEKQTNIIKTHSGYMTIRDFVTNIITVIHVEHENKKIRVITTGDINNMYPREEDYVVQRNKDHMILTYIWKKICK